MIVLEFLVEGILEYCFDAICDVFITRIIGKQRSEGFCRSIGIAIVFAVALPVIVFVAAFRRGPLWRNFKGIVTRFINAIFFPVYKCKKFPPINRDNNPPVSQTNMSAKQYN